MILFLVLSSAAPKDAYRIYSSKGKKSSYEKMLKDIQSADVVFFGEYHNNSIAHWLELEVVRDLHAAGKKLVAGCEMFEADDQEWVDLYFEGKIERDSFEHAARTWPNYKTDYRPVVEFLKANDIRLVATNVPRRYAAMLSRGGWEALDTIPSEARAWMSPLPIEIDYELPSYVAMIDMMKGHIGDLDPKNFVNAQALKDATMAHFILKNYSQGQTFYHFNGSYHSDNYEGIIWWLQQARPDLVIKSVTTREYEDISAFQADDKGAADYILYVPERMTHTY